MSDAVTIRISRRDIEADRVRAWRRSVGIKNRLPQRACTTVTRVRDSESVCAEGLDERETTDAQN